MVSEMLQLDAILKSIAIDRFRYTVKGLFIPRDGREGSDVSARRIIRIDFCRVIAQQKSIGMT